MLFFSGAEIDGFFFVLLAFCFSCLLSSFLNSFKSFSPTFIYLTLFIAIIYVFAHSNKQLCDYLVVSAFIGTILFLFVFIFKYHNELIHLNFSRLGGEFGDENDIALFNSIGLTISFYYLLYSKNLIVKILSLPLGLLFAFCGLASGSKIIIVIFAIMSIFCLVRKNGMKKWWLSIIELSLLIGLIILLFSLPAFETIRTRFLSMINLFTDKKIDGTFRDGSTITRFYMIVDGIQLFLRKPLLGFGLGGFASRGGIMNVWSHNHLSEMLCNTGIVGFVLYHLPLIYSLKFIGKDRKYEKYLMLIVLFFVQMISVALTSEKFFAFLIGVVYGKLIETKCLIKIKPIKIKTFRESCC